MGGTLRKLAYWVAAASVGCAVGTTGDTGGGGAGAAELGGGGADTLVGGDGLGAASVSSSSSVMGCPDDCASVPTSPCQEAKCNLSTSHCELQPVADTTPCDDALFCTDGDTCVSGVCTSGLPRDCGASTDCADVGCDEAADRCSFDPRPNGTSCTPEDPCVDPSVAICQGGACTGVPLDCSTTAVTAPECQVAYCDSAAGGCVVMPANDGTPCTYGSLCELDKSCVQGACVGSSIPSCTVCTETEANNTYATANTGDCAGWNGQLAAIGDKDFYAVEVTVPGSRVAAAVLGVTGGGCPVGFDSYLRLYDSVGTQVAYDDNSGADNCSAFLATTTGTVNLPVGAYYVSVEEYLNDAASPPYLLDLRVLAPGCGDGVLEVGEECDDGNLIDGDNCSSACQLSVYDCQPGEVEVAIAGAGLPAPIPDNQVNTLTNVVVVPDVGTVTKVAVALDITHVWDSDVDIFLTAPTVPQIELSTDNGAALDNYTNTVFAEGAPPITAGTPPFTGIFSPEGSFASIVGTQAQGSWTLSVYDDLGAFSGALNSWTLHLCVQP
ncbi:MAG: DVUA0089 family protein [Polyangiaceae bacterium]